MPFILDGKPLAIDTPFTHGDVQYPANWLRLASADDKAVIGITEVADAPRADDRFYWNGDITAPKDLDQLKQQFTAQVKQAAGSLLAATDWEVTRAAEGIAPMAPRTSAYRAAVRAASAQHQDAVAACASVEDLAALAYAWPTIEDAPDVVPHVVSRFQARAALLGAGLLAAVEALMADPATPAVARLAWADAQEFKRHSPTVRAMAGALGLTDAQIDGLFITAAGIDA